MKTIILATLLTLTALQAEETVHYDIKEVNASSVSKPNHPGYELYSK